LVVPCQRFKHWHGFVFVRAGNMLARASNIKWNMKERMRGALTEQGRSTRLRQMQAELDSISVEPNVEARLDRIFERVGFLYKGDYRAFFNDLDAENADTLQESDLRIPHEAWSCRASDEETN
jgi:hypothetical protein